MNLRSLTRGDAAVAGAAVLLLIASFLAFYAGDNCPAGYTGCSGNGWSSEFYPALPGVFLLGLAAAALVLVHRLRGAASETRRIAGLRLDQWGTAFAVATLWSLLWSLAGGGPNVHAAAGAWLATLATLLLTAAAVATPLVPGLRAPVLPERPAAAGSQPYPGVQGGFGGHPQAAGYGRAEAQPGAPAWAGPQQGGAQAQGPASGGYPAQGGHAQGGPGAAPEPGFAPFWFAVPVDRPLLRVDDPAGMPVGRLTPGIWYLAVEQRGGALVTQTQEGLRGLLTDTSGIQRG